jgi:Pyruvate/2-oxoacid:ferredoxin oxidoreductase gamma subunit
LAATPLVFPESIEEEIRRRFYRSADQNCAAFRRALETAAVQPSQLKIPEYEQVYAVPV